VVIVKIKTVVNQVRFTGTFLDILPLLMTPVVLLQEHIIFVVTSILAAAVEFMMSHL